MNRRPSLASSARPASLALLAAILGLAPVLFAQTPPAAAIPEGIQKALNTPAWYLHYRVVVNLSGPRNEVIQRTTTGSMMLGLRSQGASLSIITGDAKPPDLTSQLAAQQAAAVRALGANADPSAIAAAVSASLAAITPAQASQAAAQLDAFVNNYANWISGVNIDESKTDAENEAELIRVRMENLKAHHTYRWSYSGPDHTGGTSRGSVRGAGQVLHGHEPALELDAAKRRFKLLFAFLNFSDSLSTQKAATGMTEIGIGTIHHQQTPVETALYPDHLSFDSSNPSMDGFIEGPIPETGGNLSYSNIHAVTSGSLRGTVAIQLALSPKPPEAIELIIEPPANYDRWSPVAGDDERTAGDRIPIKVTLQKRGGGPPQFKARRFIYELRETTREKGVCLNWPPSPEADPPPDLQFEQEANPELYIEGTDRQKAVEIPTAAAPHTGNVTVSSFDYGAYGEFEAVAELENGQFIHGVVQGQPGGGPLKLPDCAPNSKVAKAFFTEHNLGQLADDDDGENAPVGDGFKGDGFTLYEEYRGFMHGDKWTALDPKKKDVFVLNLMRSSPAVDAGIGLFKAATGLNVHRLLWEEQVKGANRINFHYSAGPHTTDQHVIRIVAGDRMSWGATFANALNVGPPGKAKMILMPPDLGDVNGEAYFAATIAHEMLHCCNVFHHGEGDPAVVWSYQPPGRQFFEDGVPITVKREDGTAVQPAAFFPPGITRGQVGLGLAHGQHSGADYCLMRYDVAMAYASTADPSVRYLSPGEPVGTGLCNSRNGTGVNGSRQPQSRYSWAALVADGVPGVLVNRGDCEHQIRVSDNTRSPVAPER